MDQPDVPRTMRAMVLTGHGGPEVLELREVGTPAPGPGEVLVRVAAASLNNTDLWTREGAYGSRPDDPDARSGWRGPIDFPRIQGGDVAGQVVALGPGAPGDLLGQRVLVDPAHYDHPGPDAHPVDILGSERDGGFAELVVVDAARAHPVDDSPLSDVELAALPIAYGTALGMLERGRAAAGETVVVTGASGGVGLAAVQLAAARGARVVAVTSGVHADAVRRAGAHATVDRTEGDLHETLAAACPEGIDVVVDVVAGPLVAQGLDLLGDGARWVVAGALGGHRLELDVRRLYLHNIALVGSTMHTPAHFETLVELVRRGDVRPVVARTYDLADLATAQADLEGRGLVGKLVVTP
ncbi:Crotonyl-CoA reductase [Nocardioides dokdonensis FR1436]|uniref:Crotonyl-CoA reductase n=1 Tax=Nocardioides dokdonensis FR1436 TaxID=1300347 RepID=A0A1A9GRZ3_9ACTN|nr:zinc-binding dehydrogenase [Nocardioides dokdonensis]ANH40480.1 Crotonyl-CoA reductase [Nocardioides dokdonensis FR1436]